MIDQKNKRKNQKKNSKSQKLTSANKFQASKSLLKSSRYSKKYLEKRNKYRRETLEKANAELKFELIKFDRMEEENQMYLEETNDFSENKHKALKFNEVPTFIILKNERYSARNTIPMTCTKTMEQENLKPILRNNKI